MQADCKMQPCEWYAVGTSFGAGYYLDLGMIYQQISSVFPLNRNQNE